MAPHVGRKRPVGKLDGNLEPAPQARGADVLLGELPEVVGEALDGVVPRVDRPHELVHRLPGLASGAGDAAVVIVGRGCFGKNRDVGEARSEIVVQVARDARPLAIEGALALELDQPRAHAAKRDGADPERGDEQEQSGARALHEPPLPPERRDDQAHGRRRTRDAIRIRGQHLEGVVARRQPRIVRGPPAAHLPPVVIDAAQTNTEPQLLWCEEAGCRI